LREDGGTERGKISQECSEGVRIEMTGGVDGKMMTMTIAGIDHSGDYVEKVKK